jgi:hypothetical protein
MEQNPSWGANIASASHFNKLEITFFARSLLIPLIFILILSYHLGLGFLGGLFSSGSDQVSFY